MTTFTAGELDKIYALKDRVRKHGKRIVEKLDTIKMDPVLVDMSKVVIAGGCFVSWFHNEELHDIDVFVLDHFDTIYITRSFINNLIASKATVKDHKDYIRHNDKITEVFTERESTTLFDYQYIFTKYNTREALVRHFDLVHATISYNVGEDKLYVTRKAFDALREKKIQRNPDGLKTEEWRVGKFLSRGWEIDQDDSYLMLVKTHIDSYGQL